MKKLLLQLLTKNLALSHSFKQLAFLSIALTLSFTASAQNYCRAPLNSTTPNTTYTLNYTCKNVSGTTYQIILDFPNTVTNASNINIGSNPGGVNVGTSQTPVWSNSNKTLTFQFVSASNPTLYVATIFVIISGTEVRWNLPLNANFQNPCATIPAPTFGAFTAGSKVVGDADFNITPPSSNSTGAFSYSSSNTNVASIVNGNQIRIVGFTGTSTITANQAATASYSAGSTTATLTVTSPNPAPTLGTFTLAPMLTNDANFTITAPTTNSTGTFSYTSSNTAVATIVNGNQIDVLTAGTVTITAIQSYVTNFTAGSTTASLVVSVPTPTVAAPTPTVPTGNVISIYSNAYTPTAGVALNPNWGQSGLASANTTTYQVASNNTLYYPNINYQGTSFTAINLSSYKSVHLDVWTPNITNLKFALVPLSGAEKFIMVAVTPNSWNSIDILLSQYTLQNSTILNSVKEIKYENANSAGVQQGGGTLYVDNVYFDKSTTWKGTTSTNWATTTNWSTGAAPTATSDVVIATITHQPIIGSDVSINSLVIATSATLTVTSGYNLTVANAVTNSGTMTLQNKANLLQSSATTTNSNTGSIIVKRNSASLLRLDHTLWSSPVGSQNLYGFSPATLTNRFYTYNTTSNSYVTTGLSAATTFTAGKGFAVRAPNDHSSVTPSTWEGTFTGIPNNGTVPFTLDTSGSGFNLVGNPYPSPITAASFLAANSTKIEGTFYFYAHSLPMNANGTFPTGTNYSAWNTGTGGVAASRADLGIPHNIIAPVAPTGIIQVGQGFFVKAKAGASGDINFTNAIRVGNNADQFFRTTEIERHRLWLNLTTETGTDINQIAVAYVEGATQNADTNFDGLSFGNVGSMLSSKIDGANYVIQGRSLPFDSNDVVALGFKATAAGNYKIVLTNKDGLFLGNQDVFVRDNLMGIEHNIKVSPYTFASEIGTFDARFQLVYTQALGTPSSSFSPNSVLVYKNTDGFNVTTNGIVMRDILVYDISGRLIFKHSNINGTATVLKGLSQIKQVLLLKIISQENETVTVKAIN